MCLRFQVVLSTLLLSFAASASLTHMRSVCTCACNNGTAESYVVLDDERSANLNLTAASAKPKHRQLRSVGSSPVRGA